MMMTQLTVGGRNRCGGRAGAVGVSGIDVAAPASSTTRHQGHQVLLDLPATRSSRPVKGLLVAFPKARRAGRAPRTPRAGRQTAPRHGAWPASPRAAKGGTRRAHSRTVDPVTGQARADCLTRRSRPAGWSFVSVAPKDEVLAGVRQPAAPTLILIGLLALLAGRRDRVADRVAPQAARSPRWASGGRPRADRRGADLDVTVSARSEDEVRPAWPRRGFGAMVASLREKGRETQRRIQPMADHLHGAIVEPRSEERQWLGRAFQSWTAPPAREWSARSPQTRRHA